MKQVGNGKKHRGFTVVELLVVIVILAVIAGITIAGYNAAQRRAADAAVQGDLGNNAKVLATYYGDNGIFPTETQLATLSEKLGFTPTNYNTTVNAVLYCRSSDGQKIALIGKSKSGTTMYITDTYKTPRAFPGTYPGASMSASCTDAGITDPSDGTSGNWIHTTASGWDSWVK